MTELSGSTADVLAYLLVVCIDDVTPTSHFTSIVELKQAIVSAWQQLSQAFIDKSINNGVVALNA